MDNKFQMIRQKINRKGLLHVILMDHFLNGSTIMIVYQMDFPNIGLAESGKYKKFFFMHMVSFMNDTLH